MSNNVYKIEEHCRFDTRLNEALKEHGMKLKKINREKLYDIFLTPVVSVVLAVGLWYGGVTLINHYCSNDGAPVIGMPFSISDKVAIYECHNFIYSKNGKAVNIKNLSRMEQPSVEDSTFKIKYHFPVTKDAGLYTRTVETYDIKFIDELSIDSLINNPDSVKSLGIEHTTSEELAKDSISNEVYLSVETPIVEDMFVGSRPQTEREDLIDKITLLAPTSIGLFASLLFIPIHFGIYRKKKDGIDAELEKKKQKIFKRNTK